MVISKLFKLQYQISEYRQSNWFRQLMMSLRNFEYSFGFSWNGEFTGNAPPPWSQLALMFFLPHFSLTIFISAELNRYFSLTALLFPLAGSTGASSLATIFTLPTGMP